MHRKQHRFLSILAASTVALTLSAAPALAGSDGCVGGDCQDENAPATVVPAVPTPVAPAPLQSSNSDTTGGGTAPETASKSKPKKTTKQTRTTQTRTVAAAQRTIPQGAVAAGAGGMAPDGSNGVIFGLAGAALVMFATGGRLVVAARRS